MCCRRPTSFPIPTRSSKSLTTEIPARFRGLTVAIIGGGPSHADLDLALLKGRRFIAVNSACRKVSPIATAADLLFFHDDVWAETYPELVRDWPGLVVTTNAAAKARFGDRVWHIDTAVLAQQFGASHYHLGVSSGHAASALAVLMGAKRLLLAGFECRSIDGRTHGHDDYRQPELAAFANRFLPAWHALAPVFHEHGVEVLNVTPGSALTDFPVVDLADAVRASSSTL